MHLPTFICIGSMKGGTSSLHRYLGEHPQVCVSNPKETDFFLERTEKDLAWYRGCFKGEAKAYGEVSPNYAKHPVFPAVPKRMHELLPEARLIYLVRDPIDRAISHYVHNWAKRRETDSIDQAFRPVEESWYLNVSRYYFQLSQYLQYYSKEDILVVQSEHLREYRDKVMQSIFRFIGVDPHAVQRGEAFEEEHHTSSQKTRPTAVAEFLARSSLGAKLKNALKRGVPKATIEWVKEALWTDVEKPTPNNNSPCRLRSR